MRAVDRWAPRCNVLVVAALTILAATPSARAAEVASSPPRSRCAEDSATGEPPTISSRFDLPSSGESNATFREARARAARYCATLACTIEGRAVARNASIYALGLLHRRYIAGFRCIPAGEESAGQQPPPAPLTYTLGEPSEIDAALARANEQCAGRHAKAELSDLQRQGEGLVATFACAL
jgi:hypothetical protein